MGYKEPEALKDTCVNNHLTHHEMFIWLVRQTTDTEIESTVFTDQKVACQTTQKLSFMVVGFLSWSKMYTYTAVITSTKHILKLSSKNAIFYKQC